MQSAFKAAMLKLSTIGQDTSKMIDCSEVLPTPKTIALNPHFPAGLTLTDVEQAVSPRHTLQTISVVAD